jgi:hypothetical protein
MITARNSIVLALLSVITGRAAAQLPASAPTAVGTWRGTSLCQVRPSPCSDENIVYRITRVGLGDSLSIDGRKIVNGREEEMGIIGCHVLATRDEVVCARRQPHGRAATSR